MLDKTSHLQSGFWRSSKLVFLKSSTKNPVLNLDNPSASWTCNVLVSNSSNERDVNSSRFSILSSRVPISLIVYLRLSTRVIFAFLGLYKYGGNSIVPIVIAVSTSSGTTGFSDDVPLITWNWPLS